MDAPQIDIAQRQQWMAVLAHSRTLGRTETKS